MMIKLNDDRKKIIFINIAKIYILYIIISQISYNMINNFYNQIRIYEILFQKIFIKYEIFIFIF